MDNASAAAHERACQEMQLPADAAALLHATMTPHAAVLALLDAGQDQAALKLVARLMPKRYVVAWLCQCARGEHLDPDARAGASLAERWLRDPAEANRRAAYEYATTGEYASLGAWFSAAAGWADGSLAPAGQATTVPPPDHLTAVAAVAAVNLLAATDTEHFEVRRRHFIEQALGLLDGLTA